MILQDYIKELNIPYIHKNFARRYYEEHADLGVSKAQLETLYAKLFEELSAIRKPRNSCSEGLITVTESYDAISETEDHFTHDASVLLANGDCVAVISLYWSEVIFLDFNPQSIYLYGVENCVYATLNDMVFFGWTLEEHDDKLVNIIETCENSEIGCPKEMSIEALCKAAGIDPLTEEELEIYKKLNEKIEALNDVYQDAVCDLFYQLISSVEGSDDEEELIPGFGSLQC